MRVEWLILADGAQTVGNKLYLLGGGWDTVSASTSFPVEHHMAVAVSFLVPWDETNMKHNFQLEILTEDGVSLTRIGGQFEVGRPAGIPGGSEQRSQIAVDMMIALPKVGVYVVVAKLEDIEQGKTTFRVVDSQRTRFA